MRALSFVLSSVVLSVATFSDAAAIPAWARRYNVNCSHCHLGAAPTLNATGIRFRWAGYRMPEDIGQDEKMERISNYLSARAKIRYSWEKTAGEPVAASEFSLDEVNLYYAGAFGRNFGGFMEFAGEGGSFGAEMVTVTAVWGTEKAHGGFRFGQQKAFQGAGVAGFDRPIGLATAIPLDNAITSSSPFRLKGEPVGMEAFYVMGSNRAALAVYNGQQSGTTTKDFVASDQLLIDDKGSAIEVLGYYGTRKGLDPLLPEFNSHSWRLGVTANKVIGGTESNFMVLGGLVFGQDNNLPASFSSTSNKGKAYWFSGQYLFPGPALSVYGRYEFLDPSTSASNDGVGRIVFGGVLPVGLLQNLRLTAEYVRDKPQGTGPARSAVVGEVALLW